MPKLGKTRVRFNFDEMYIFDTRCTHFSKKNVHFLKTCKYYNNSTKKFKLIKRKLI